MIYFQIFKIWQKVVRVTYSFLPFLNFSKHRIAIQFSERSNFRFHVTRLDWHRCSHSRRFVDSREVLEVALSWYRQNARKNPRKRQIHHRARQLFFFKPRWKEQLSGKKKLESFAIRRSSWTGNRKSGLPDIISLIKYRRLEVPSRSSTKENSTAVL